MNQLVHAHVHDDVGLIHRPLKDAWKALVLFLTKKDFVAMPKQENYTPGFWSKNFHLKLVFLPDNYCSIWCIFSVTCGIWQKLHHPWLNNADSTKASDLHKHRLSALSYMYNNGLHYFSYKLRSLLSIYFTHRTPSHPANQRESQEGSWISKLDITTLSHATT